MSNEQTSEWVERGVELAENAARESYRACDYGDRSYTRSSEALLAALRAHLESREALVKQLAEALKYARRMVKPSECDSAYIDAALVAYQEKT